MRSIFLETRDKPIGLATNTPTLASGTLRPSTLIACNCGSTFSDSPQGQHGKINEPLNGPKP